MDKKIIDEKILSSYIKENLTAYKISRKLKEEHGEAVTPSAVTTNIKNIFNMQWDSKNKKWINIEDNKDMKNIEDMKGDNKINIDDYIEQLVFSNNIELTVEANTFLIEMVKRHITKKFNVDENDLSSIISLAFLEVLQNNITAVN